VPVLYLVAIVLAPGYRRRTLVWVGCSIGAAGGIVVVGRAVLRTPIANSLVGDVSLRPAVKDVVTIATAPLNDLGVALIIGGLVTAIVAAVAPVLASPLRRAP
jgi:predicted DNA repair protein MutK